MKTNNLDRCFGCGKDNPIGLRLETTYIGERSQIEFEVESNYCGYPGLLHGGVIALLIDEVMFHAVATLGIETVTVNMNIDYKNAALEGHHLICEAWIVHRDGRKIDVFANIIDRATGRIIAEGKGRYVEVDLQKILQG